MSACKGTEAAQKYTATGVIKWKRFDRRWWTWLTNPWKSAKPWQRVEDVQDLFHVSHGPRYSDKQHAHCVLKQEFATDVDPSEINDPVDHTLCR